MEIKDMHDETLDEIDDCPYEAEDCQNCKFEASDMRWDTQDGVYVCPGCGSVQ
jgi:hypothetical protein